MVKKINLLIVLLGVAIIVSGCGASHMAIIKPVASDIEKARAIQINEIKPLPEFAQQMCDQLRQIIIKKLEAKGVFDSVSGQGGTIALDIKVVSFDIGDQFARWFWGGIGNMGEGKIVLETTYIDLRNNSELGKITTEGTVTCGFFGGSIDTAYCNAVDEMVKYTVTNFGRKK